MTYFSNMPVTHLIIKTLIVSILEHFAEAKPAAAYSLGDITNAVFFFQLVGDVLISIALLLQLDDASVVRVVVGDDTLRDRCDAPWDT